jgi:hypothetical protein
MQLKLGVVFPVNRDAPTVVSVTARSSVETTTHHAAVTQLELDAALASDDVAADIQLGGGWG